MEGIMSWFSFISDWFLPKKLSQKDLGLLLVEEASKWVGLKEDKAVNVFRKAVDGKAAGEAWCAGFVQYCLVAISTKTKAKISIPPSEQCVTIWSGTSPKYKVDYPDPGCLMLWRRPNSTKGHIGIIEYIDAYGIHTIEGNTSDPEKQSQSNGVYRKTRSFSGSSDMVVLGFIKPFQ